VQQCGQGSAAKRPELGAGQCQEKLVWRSGTMASVPTLGGLKEPTVFLYFPLFSLPVLFVFPSFGRIFSNGTAKWLPCLKIASHGCVLRLAPRSVRSASASWQQSELSLSRRGKRMRTEAHTGRRRRKRATTRTRTAHSTVAWAAVCQSRQWPAAAAPHGAPPGPPGPPSTRQCA
jgi:hypothetical protein